MPALGEGSFGVYQIYWGEARFEKGLQQQIEALGAVPSHVLFFRDMAAGRGFPAAAAEVCRSYGATPVISQELTIWGKRERSFLKEIISGETDEFWVEWAREAVGFGDEVIFRFGFEMNGDWFSWGAQPELFKQAWRRVHDIFEREGAGNVAFMFSPNVVWDKEKAFSGIEQYYPGDDVVDVLGLDGYNFGDSFSEWHSWQSYEEVFEESIRTMKQSDKPLYLAEVGCADGPKKADWLKDFFARALNDPRLEGVIYYNFADGKNWEPDWRLTSDQKSLEVTRAALREEGP